MFLQAPIATYKTTPTFQKKITHQVYAETARGFRLQNELSAALAENQNLRALLEARNSTYLSSAVNDTKLTSFINKEIRRTKLQLVRERMRKNRADTNAVRRLQEISKKDYYDKSKFVRCMKASAQA